MQSGIFGGLVAQHNGDVAAATRATYEALYWSTPQFREREMTKAAATQTQAVTEKVERTTKAAALSGGGGQAVSREAIAAMSPADRKQYFVQQLAADMAARQGQ